MQILITAALFPPDVADPAAYIKELAARLARKHSVTILTYGHIPESVANVTIHVIPKSQSTVRRLFQFARVLRTLSREAEAVIINNAPSTEVPLIFSSWFNNRKWFLLPSDTKIIYTGWRKFFHTLALKRAQLLDIPLPQARPEILPFKKPSESVWQQYESSWEKHITTLNKLLHE